jgi:hypothetical protein
MLPPMLPRPSPERPLVLAGLLLALGLGLAGCKDKIGDSCSYNVDCASTGDRLCDLASPGGYCTIENCTQDSCPDDGVCIAFYPVEFLTVPCDPNTEDVADPATGTDDCTIDELCTRSGFCAPLASLSRFCMKKCDKNSDCRTEYECRRTGLNGAELVPPVGQAHSDAVGRFCAAKYE